MRNVIRAILGRPVKLSPKQEEKMARMRAKAEAMSGSRTRPGAGAGRVRGVHRRTARAARRSAPRPRPVTPQTTNLRELFKQSFEQARDEFGAGFDDRRDVIDAGEGTDINRPPPGVDDPVQREALPRRALRARGDAQAVSRARAA